MSANAENFLANRTRLWTNPPAPDNRKFTQNLRQTRQIETIDIKRMCFLGGGMLDELEAWPLTGHSLIDHGHAAIAALYDRLVLLLSDGGQGDNRSHGGLSSIQSAGIPVDLHAHGWSLAPAPSPTGGPENDNPEPIAG